MSSSPPVLGHRSSWFSGLWIWTESYHWFSWVSSLQRQTIITGTNAHNKSHLIYLSMYPVGSVSVKNFRRQTELEQWGLNFCGRKGNPFWGLGEDVCLALRDACLRRCMGWQSQRVFCGGEPVREQQHCFATWLSVLGFEGMGLVSRLSLPITLTQRPLWWCTHCSPQVDSSQKDSGRLVGHLDWRVLSPFDLSRIIWLVVSYWFHVPYKDLSLGLCCFFFSFSFFFFIEG